MLSKPCTVIDIKTPKQLAKEFDIKGLEKIKI